MEGSPSAGRSYVQVDEPGHSHTSRRIAAACRCRRTGPRRRGRDLAAPGRRRPRRVGQRQAGGPVLPADVRCVGAAHHGPAARKRCTCYRHSTAHLLAAAVTALFPGTQCGIGPATDEGFFYDFIVSRPFVPEDLDAIEKKMKELAAADLPYLREMWPREDAQGVLREPRRAAEGAADRGEDGGPVRGLLLPDQGPRHVRRLLCRAARAFVRQAEGVQAADARRTRTGRATRRTRRCSASTARRSSRTRSSPRT